MRRGLAAATLCRAGSIPDGNLEVDSPRAALLQSFCGRRKKKRSARGYSTTLGICVADAGELRETSYSTPPLPARLLKAPHRPSDTRKTGLGWRAPVRKANCSTN